MNKYIAVVSMSVALGVSGASTSLYAGGGHAKAGKEAVNLKTTVSAKAHAKMITEGKARTAVCAGCHGADGNGTNDQKNPKLAGQNPAYIFKQLKDFQSRTAKVKGDPTYPLRQDGTKVDPKTKQSHYGIMPGIMNGMAASLSDTDMRNIAAYYGSLKIKPGNSDEALKALGKKIYVGGNKLTGVPACIGCHGPAGEGNNAALYPAIGGQNAVYAEAQIKHFRTAGLIMLAQKNASKEVDKKRAGRKNDKDARMQTVVTRMTDVEIKAVASYLQGLRLNK